ncbi:MAG TPA: glycosyltransferase [Patescibacteria group bacterium]|nr:glycosyltransferase [Patescibacteria group bacterium]
MSIYAHCLVKNEENFIWYSVASVVEYVDKVMIWDNGSSDNTIKVIEALKNRWPSKIDFKKFSGEVSEARQQMIGVTDADWFIILDGDEVWWNESIKKLVAVINEDGKNLDSIVVPFKNLTRDMFHFQDEGKGKYKIDEKEGFLTIKAINMKIENLHIGNEYPFEGYFGKNNIPIQNLISKRRVFLETPYLHLTHLRRSSKKSEKIKKRNGLSFPLDFYYPEVFFRPRPDFILTPW